MPVNLENDGARIRQIVDQATWERIATELGNQQSHYYFSYEPMEYTIPITFTQTLTEPVERVEVEDVEFD